MTTYLNYEMAQLRQQELLQSAAQRRKAHQAWAANPRSHRSAARLLARVRVWHRAASMAPSPC